MKDFQFSFELWEDIPPVISYHDTPRVSVSEKGLFAMNGAMRRNVGDQRAFRVKISPDGYYLALCTEQAPNVQFSRQSGYTTHHRLKELLRSTRWSGTRSGGRGSDIVRSCRRLRTPRRSGG